MHGAHQQHVLAGIVHVLGQLLNEVQLLFRVFFGRVFQKLPELVNHEHEGLLFLRQHPVFRIQGRDNGFGRRFAGGIIGPEVPGQGLFQRRIFADKLREAKAFDAGKAHLDGKIRLLPSQALLQRPQKGRLARAIRSHDVEAVGAPEVVINYLTENGLGIGRWQVEERLLRIARNVDGRTKQGFHNTPASPHRG